MEKHERKIKPIFIIICIIYISIISVISYFIIDTHNKFKNEIKSKNKYTEEINKLNTELTSTKTEEDKLLKEIDNLNNIKANTETIKKEVFQLASQLEKQIKEGKSNAKIAYLTFDDGPYNLTNSFLSILDKYEVKATFFTIGQDKDKCFDNRSQDCSTMYKKIVDKGHTIANHTYNHSIFGSLYSSVSSFMYQITLQENLIKNRTGVTTNIIRFPGGSATAGYLKNGIITELRKRNYGWVDWTAQNGDGGALSSKSQAWNNFVGTIDSKIEVVLFHDYNSITLSMLPEAIEYLQKNNYIILPLFYDSVMVNK